MNAWLNKARLTAVFNAVTDGIAVFDAQGNLVLANQAQARMNGFASIEEMLHNLSFYAELYEFEYPEGGLVPLAQWPAARGLRGESFQNWVVKGRRRDTGKEWFFSFSAEPVRDQSGAVTMVVVVTRDITGPQRLAGELLESESRYATMHAAAPFGISVTRVSDQVVLSVNDAFLRIFECSREEVLGKTGVAAGLIDAEARRRLEEVLARVGQVRDFEFIRPSKSGAPRTLALNVDRITLDGQPVLLSSTIDITGRKQEERKVEESEARYRAVFEQAALGMAVIETSSGRFLEANERLCTMLGYSRAELERTNWQALTHPDDLASNVAGVQAMMANRTPLRVEKRYVRKDGSTLWARVTVNPVALPSEPTTTQIAMIEDVTEQRLATEQFQQVQKLESIGRLAGGIAHDFNNLLTVILTCGEAVQSDLEAGARPDPEDVREINLAGRRAQELTGQLLAFARRQLIEPVDLDLNAVVKSSQKMMERLVGEDVEVHTTLEPQLWRTWADSGQLNQVLMNLTVNARDAMPHGGTLTFETHNRAYDAPHPYSGDWVQLIVRDSGQGISAEAKAHLFEPFFTTKPHGKGTGLGLATVYGIVTGAGGHLVVESEPGKGATFQVLLPRTERVAAPRRVELSGKSQRGIESVLVVEDDPQVREVTIRTLKSAGYQVASVPLPREALDFPNETLRQVQLLVTDVVMPGLNGRQLAQELCARHPALQVLYLSGYTRDAIAEHGVIDADIELLQKPFTSATLLARVRAVLDTKRIEKA